MNSRRIIISRSRNPFEVFLLIACILSGIAGILNSGRTSSVVREDLPSNIVHIWYLGLAVGGIITLIGAIGPKLIYLYIERLGLVLLSGITLGYSSVLILQISRPLAFPVLTLLFFSIACIARLIQVHRELKRGPE